MSKPAPPVVKFPDESGLRPIAQNFSAVVGIGLGNWALWLQPTSRFERLHLNGPQLEGDSFTIEAVAQLDGIHPDGTVNTLVSRWDGDQASKGWSFGVTSAQSSYGPRNFIVQLTGSNTGGDVEYEVVASNLRVPTGRPVYLAAEIIRRPGGGGGGKVRFHLKDLSDPEAELQVAEVAHNIVSDIQNPAARLLIGGRDAKDNAHLWDGQLARLEISTGAVDAAQAFAASSQVLIETTFAGGNGAEPIPGSNWLRRPVPARAKPNPTLDAVADFCHALLSSNEFLYLH